MRMAEACEKLAARTTGKEALAIEAYAKALRVNYTPNEWKRSRKTLKTSEKI